MGAYALHCWLHQVVDVRTLEWRSVLTIIGGMRCDALLVALGAKEAA